MSGEMVLVRRVLQWGPLAACAGAGLAFTLRGTDGAVSVACAAALVLGNTLGSAALLAGAAKLSPMAGPMVALPSFALRMGCLLGALAWLKGRSFIDPPSFALAFGLAVTATLVMEARAWKRTPWLALTLKEKL